MTRLWRQLCCATPRILKGHYRTRDSVLLLPSMRLVQPPRKSRQIAKLLALLFVLTPIMLIFVPWQQSVSGSGSVVAFDPVDRPQEIDAPIGGRINNWFVVEGTRVNKGDSIVEIIDNDPNYLERLESQREAVRSQA